MFDYPSRAFEIASNQGIRELIGAIRRHAAQEAQYQYKHIRRWCRQIPHRGAIAPPYQVITINPQKVAHLISPNFQASYPSDASFLADGNWDQPDEDTKLMFYNRYEGRFTQRHCVPLNNYSFYTAVEAHLRDGVPWDETEFYQWVTTADLPSRSFYAQEETREWRFDQIDRLAASISEDGYKTQDECNGESTPPSRDEYADESSESSVPPEHHEVTIDIGRDGNLFFEEGRHRFAVARALGLESIPVRVFVRHTNWQHKRSEIAQATTPEDVPEKTQPYITHPDMKDVASFRE